MADTDQGLVSVVEKTIAVTAGRVFYICASSSSTHFQSSSWTFTLLGSKDPGWRYHCLTWTWVLSPLSSTVVLPLPPVTTRLKCDLLLS